MQTQLRARQFLQIETLNNNKNRINNNNNYKKIKLKSYGGL